MATLCLTVTVLWGDSGGIWGRDYVGHNKKVKRDSLSFKIYVKIIVWNFENFVKNFGQNISKFRNLRKQISK
jgi:hypothetical protein